VTRFGLVSIARRPRTRAGGCLSGGGVVVEAGGGVVEVGGGVVEVGGGAPPPDVGGGGGGGLDATAVATPMPRRAATAHAAATARSPPRNLALPTSTATFEPEMSISTRLQQLENPSSCASIALDINWKHTPVGRDTTALRSGVHRCAHRIVAVRRVRFRSPCKSQEMGPSTAIKRSVSCNSGLSPTSHSGMPTCAWNARC
jgi:hypothetical protein